MNRHAFTVDGIDYRRPAPGHECRPIFEVFADGYPQRPWMWSPDAPFCERCWMAYGSAGYASHPPCRGGDG